MTDKEVMQMALDALNNFDKGNHGMRWQVPVIEALRTALAQPEHEPVGRFAKFSDGIWKEVTDGSAGQPLYTVPPQREWVGLTHEEHMEILTRDLTAPSRIAVAEALLKEKNCDK